MFYYIRGVVGYKTTGVAVIEAGGVGYKMTVSENTYHALPALGAEAKLYTHLAVREDGIELFGFYGEPEMHSFKMLLAISGVGPKAALSILSLLTPEKLAMAICTDDKKTIAKASGIGPKTAARIILELKDKMMKENPTGAGRGVSGEDILSVSSPSNGLLGEAQDALMVLGYSRAEALTATKDLPADGSMSVEDLIKNALRKLMR